MEPQHNNLNGSAKREELDIISYLSNPRVRSSTKYITSQYPVHSQLNKDLMEYYRGLNDNYVPEDGPLRATLIRKNFTDNEVELAIIKKNLYANVGVDGVEALIDGLVDHYKRSKILDAVGKFRSEQSSGKHESEDNLIKSLTALENIHCKHLDLIDLSEIESAATILAAELGDPIPSAFSVCNNSCAFGSYLKGMLVQVNAPPGVGKTTFMLGECIFQAMHGFKTVYVAIGDMMLADLLTKTAAIVTGVDYRNVITDPDRYMTKDVRKVLANIRFLIYSAGEVDAASLAASLSNLPKDQFDFDSFFIDYDLNLKKTSESMYDQGGMVYDEFSKLTRKRGDYKLGFIASQVKTEFWGVEIIPEKCSAESSKKQHIIDMMININLNEKNKQIGSINIPKQRRGDLMLGRYARHPSGRFLEISNDDYESAKKTGRVEYDLNE